MRCWGLNSEPGKHGPDHHRPGVSSRDRKCSQGSGRDWQENDQGGILSSGLQRPEYKLLVLSVFLLWMSIPTGGEEGEGRCLRQEVTKELEPTLRAWFLYKLSVKEGEFGRTLSSSSDLPPFHSCQNFFHEPNIRVFWKEAFLHKTQKWQVLNPSPVNAPASWQGLRMNSLSNFSPWLELGVFIAFDLGQALNSNSPANLHKSLCIGLRLKLTLPELRKETEV